MLVFSYVFVVWLPIFLPHCLAIVWSYALLVDLSFSFTFNVIL